MMYTLIKLLFLCFVLGLASVLHPTYESSVKPLTPWLSGSKHKFSDSCVVIESWNSGLGCELNFLWWVVALMKQQNPSAQVYYNHAGSRYQCWANSSLSAFFLPRTDMLLLNDVQRPPPGCAHWGMMQAVNFVRQYLLYEWNQNPPGSIQNGIYQVSLKSPMLEHALQQSRCQVLHSFWNIVPDLRQSIDKTVSKLFSNRTVIALHIRSGDKGSELFGEVDENGRYRMDGGMHKLLHRYPSSSKGALCIVLGDDEGYAKATGLLAKKLLHCEEVITRVASTNNGGGHFQDNFNAMGLEDRCTRTKGLLEDIEIMAAAHYFIGIPRSNLDHIVAALRMCLYYHAEDTTLDGSGRAKFGIWS